MHNCRKISKIFCPCHNHRCPRRRLKTTTLPRDARWEAKSEQKHPTLIEKKCKPKVLPVIIGVASLDDCGGCVPRSLFQDVAFEPFSAVGGIPARRSNGFARATVVCHWTWNIRADGSYKSLGRAAPTQKQKR